MVIVGEKINTSRKNVEDAVRRRDAAAIAAMAREQAEAGAHYIDINAGTFVDEEVDCLCWLTETVQQAVPLPLSLDSPNPVALAEAMKLHRGEPMVNSISLEQERLDSLLPVITSQPCSVVALCMARTSMPVTTEERVQVGSELVETLTAEGVPREKIYVDPLIQPVSVNTDMGVAALGAIRRIMEDFPGVNNLRPFERLLRSARAAFDQPQFPGSLYGLRSFGGHPGPDGQTTHGHSALCGAPSWTGRVLRQFHRCLSEWSHSRIIIRQTGLC